MLKAAFLLTRPIAAALLLLVVGCRSWERLDCSYWARATVNKHAPEARELQPRGACATRQPDGAFAIDPIHLEAIAFSDGLAPVLTSEGWLYVTPAGRTVRVLTYDSGPDYFSEGLARTLRAGIVGFVDRNLSEVIPPIWDFAFPFTNGLAVVCEGCGSRPTLDGEHSEIRGGLWGRINRRGEVVVPVRFERGDLPASPP